MKRYFSVLTMICVFALAGIAGAVAQEANPATDFTYDLNGDGEGVVIQKYKGKATAVVIPAVIEDFPVVEVGYRAFEETNIVSIILPDEYRSCSGLNQQPRCRSSGLLIYQKRFLSIKFALIPRTSSPKNVRPCVLLV